MTVWSIVILPDTATFCSALQYWIRDQEFFTQFVSIDILWAHRLHIVPLQRKQSMASAFLCGPTVFCRTGRVFATHAPLQPMGYVSKHNSVDTHKVKTWSRCCLLVNSAHAWTKKPDRQGREGWQLLHSWPLNVMQGVAHHFYENAASVIFDFDQQRCSDEISLICVLLSRWLDFSKLGSNLAYRL